MVEYSIETDVWINVVPRKMHVIGRIGRKSR